MKYLSRLLLIVGFLVPFCAKAATFANQFIEFQLPAKWECKLDGTEWVCQSTDEQKKRDAIIVLAAKIKKAGMDEIAVYKDHLQKKQEYTSLSGEKVSSEPRYVKERSIAGHPWIDALHLQSEIPDFYTRYLATVESDLGILVTFSVRKDKYEEYAPDIESMVGSLRAFRKPGSPNQTGEVAPVAEAPVDIQAQVGAPKPKPKKDDSGTLLVLLLVGAGAVGFVIWKKRQGG